MTTPIANAFADEFVAFERETQKERYEDGLRLVEARIEQLSEGGESDAEKGQLQGLKDQARNLELLASLRTGDVQVIERASGQGTPVGSSDMRRLLLAALLGALIGIGAAFIRDRVDPRLKREEQLDGVLPGIPIVARIPRIGRKAADREVAAERFQLLQLDLEARARNSGDSNFLLVTSPGAGEAKSSTAANLALAIWQRGHSVTLVEADLRNPELSRLAGAKGPGVASVLRDEKTVEEVTQTVSLEPSSDNGTPRLAMSGDLMFIPAGAMGQDQARLFNNDALGKLFSQLINQSSSVVIDGPPLGLFGDMAPVAAMVDRVLVVVRLGHTRAGALQRLGEQLGRSGVEPFGFVVVGGPSADTSEYGSYYNR